MLIILSSCMETVYHHIISLSKQIDIIWYCDKAGDYDQLLHIHIMHLCEIVFYVLTIIHRINHPINICCVNKS